MRRFLLPVALILLAAVPAAAQVGYDPSLSPFHDVRHSRYLELFGGRIFGSGGSIPVGPRDGTVMGARVDFRAKNTVQIGFGAWYAGTVRNIVDADDSVATRVKPAVANHLFGGEISLQFNLTGGKSWRGIAPYAGVGIGVVKGQKTPAADTSGYAFGTKLYFAPNIGTRLILSERTFLKVEGKAYFWSIKYPVSYSDEPTKQPGTGDVINAVNATGKKSSYVPAPALQFGFGYSF
ncbi:MAG: hypothetical protein ABIZ70_10290 [Gemmatimonadales bacterium]